MNLQGPKKGISGIGGAGFKAGPTAAKNSIKQASVAKSAQANKTTESDKSTNNNSGEVAKSEANQAQAYTRPGQTAKSSKEIGKRGSKAQDILNTMRKGRESSSAPGAAYNKISSAQVAANDAAKWQAHLKGSAETAKAIATGAAAIGKGAGQALAAIGGALQKKAQQSKAEQSGGQQAGGGQQSAQQQQQQQAAQQQDMFAQNDVQGGGGAQNA